VALVRRRQRHGVDDAAELVTSLARLTGLLGAYLALVQVLLLARLPWLDRLAGFDHLTVIHRWNGHACVALVVAHTALSTWGYALLDDVGIWAEVETLLGAGVYPGMITATVGTALIVAVGLTSVVVARRRLPYEWWYAIHLTAYVGIAPAWFHLPLAIPHARPLVGSASVFRSPRRPRATRCG
jgi:predicted ferric reductase